MSLKHLHIFLTAAVTLLLVAGACTPEWEYDMIPGTSVSRPDEGAEAGRDISTDTRKVLLLYSAGFNSISSYLKEDIEDLSKGWVPRQRRNEDVILVYSHQPSSRGQYSKKTSPVLFRLYSTSEGVVVRDTLAIYKP